MRTNDIWLCSSGSCRSNGGASILIAALLAELVKMKKPGSPIMYSPNTHCTTWQVAFCPVGSVPKCTVTPLWRLCVAKCRVTAGRKKCMAFVTCRVVQRRLHEVITGVLSQRRAGTGVWMRRVDEVTWRCLGRVNWVVIVCFGWLWHVLVLVGRFL